MRSLFVIIGLFLILSGLSAQTNQTLPPSVSLPIKVYPANSEGVPIYSIIMLIHKDGQTIVADSAVVAQFDKGVNIYPGMAFSQPVADMAMKRIESNAKVKSASYELYGTQVGGNLIFVVNIYLLQPGEHKSISGKSGMIASKSIRDFPTLLETDHAKLTLILNGGAGLYNETNSFFGQGAAFTKGNPVANDPAGKGVRFWGETYLEPGVAGITQLGRSKIYAFGALSAMVTARNAADIYSSGSAAYIDFERLYGGLLFTGLGKSKQGAIQLSYGRQFFQLNDGFLISKYSGSANAGKRGSVYLNARTTFQKAGLLRINARRWSLEGFYLEPEELFKDKQSNIGYAGANIGYNDNKHFDVSIAYLNRVSGTGNYITPFGEIPRKGLSVFNPKVWITNIGGTGLFFKSEYAYEAHTDHRMRANAWYAGVGIDMKKWSYRPMLYYRYAFMQGDKGSDNRYTRFDPILTGGLGDWVQGIIMRKMLGSGNIITHRLQYKMFPSQSLELSFDYFHLQADAYSNLGGPAPLSELKSKHLGDEFTFTGRYFINNHFMLLGVVSYAHPGSGIRKAFTEPTKDWSSVQLALFMFF